MMEQEVLQNNAQEEPKPISGWLAFFLWIGVGLGAIISSVLTISELAGIGWTPFSIFVFIGYLGSLVAVAVLTIIAFYRRKENAVSLAMTYVLMIALDGVLQIAIAVIVNDETMIKDIIQSFVWSIIWFVYLICSKQVKEQVPEGTRKWKPMELILLAVFIISGISYCMGLNQVMKDPTESNLVSKEYLIKSAIEGINEELPSMSNGVMIEGVELQGMMIVYNFKLPNTALADINIDYLKKYSIAVKQEIIQGYILEDDEDVIKLYDLFFNNGYDVCYYYKDMNNQMFYSILTTPSDYNKAKEAGENFRCDRRAWDELVSQANKELPTVYMGDCQLTNISVDFEENVLKYEIELPKMESYFLKQFITKDYLKNYINENIESLSDYLWTMASIDKMDLHYHFVTSIGQEHTTIVIPHKEYSQYK